MSYQKRPLHSPENNLPESKISNLDCSVDSEVSFSTSFVSANSAQGSENYYSENTLTSVMAASNENLDYGTAPDIVDLICTMVFEINGQPYLSPSMSDDDAFLMLRQV